jgi:hypothetical protein
MILWTFEFESIPRCAQKRCVLTSSGEFKLRCEGRGYAKTPHDYYIYHNYHSAFMFFLSK